MTIKTTQNIVLLKMRFSPSFYLPRERRNKFVKCRVIKPTSISTKLTLTDTLFVHSFTDLIATIGDMICTGKITDWIHEGYDGRKHESATCKVTSNWTGPLFVPYCMHHRYDRWCHGLHLGGTGTTTDGHAWWYGHCHGEVSQLLVNSTSTAADWPPLCFLLHGSLIR
jgi:hypothetical protein